MRLDFLAHYNRREGPLHRLDARAKLLATVAFVVSVVATPVGAWQILAAEGLALAFVLGLSGARPADLLGRWLGLLALVGFLAVMVAMAHPERARLGLAAVSLAIVARNSLALLAVLVLASVTPLLKLLTALRRLGMPPVLVATLQFMCRYMYVLTDELDRMSKARRARTFRRSGRLDWGLLTGLIGVLFLRALERGERVHAAMVARGWDGTLRALDPT
jgi:cobalt/nickel transport system permease protein